MQATFHLPGLYCHYPFYQAFLPIYFQHPEYFYDFVQIGSIYGAPRQALFAGGRIVCEDIAWRQPLFLLQKYGIAARLTFSNSLLKPEHLSDELCNEICRFLVNLHQPRNGVIVASDCLRQYLQQNYPNLALISSTTKVLEKFEDLVNELNQSCYEMVVADYRLNKAYDQLLKLTPQQRGKVEFLCNECCPIDCSMRKQCYQYVSAQVLHQQEDHFCCPNQNQGGYRFSLAQENPSFISLADIQNWYLPHGFTQFKIEGRGVGSGFLLEFILYYLTKPEYHITLREQLYLTSDLDLF